MRILIAEDDAVSRLIVEAAVRKLGHEVGTAADGEQAWAMFLTGAFDAIICDRQMPLLDGEALCRRIRAHPADHYPYFIFLTAQSERESALSGMEAGADDYLSKPVRFDELTIRLAVAERIAALHRQLAKQRGELERLNLRLLDQTRLDPLTGAGSRRKLEEDLAGICERAARYGENYCAAMCDVDFFKQYNDTYGHVAGDEALRSVAEALRHHCRAGDEVYRYGGEEFLIVMRTDGVAAAAAGAERCRAAVEAIGIPHAPSPSGCVTISLGVAALDRSTLNVTAWLQQADAALYEAKRSGRNRVAASGAGVRLPIEIESPLSTSAG